MAKTANPWDQRKDESDTAYSHFLIYRNLGPARSIDAAFQSVPQPKAKRGKTRRRPKRASGTWFHEAERYAWVERAAAWDVETLVEVGRSVVVNFINILTILSKKTVIAAASERIRPRSLAAVMEMVNLLGSFIPADTVAAIRADSESRRVAAIGASGNKDQ